APLDLRRPLRYGDRTHRTYGVLDGEERIGFAQSYSLRELVQFLVQEWSNQPSGWQDFQTQFRRLHCQ
ncbi:MAG TPA: hypothetical protein PLY80_21125, partial [Pseudomonadota bacterium]|nr:hypothetical protein [Pseudomonadota bacterium]